MINKSKIRKWKTYIDSNNHQYSDLYFIYNLPKDKIGDYLNVWFDGLKVYSKLNKSKHICEDEIITLKKCDNETATHLYDRKFNPITINILCPAGTEFIQDNDNILYDMKFQIHSIDDSSYGIWWSNKPFALLENIRTNIMKFINTNTIINGERLLEYCIEQGADENSKDCN